MEVNNIQSQIIDALREKRMNPSLLIEEIDALESQQQAQYHLNQLIELDLVDKPSRGVYELAPWYRRKIEFAELKEEHDSIIDSSPTGAGDGE